jgi:xylan 1,4-beta-xylosidase
MVTGGVFAAHATIAARALSSEEAGSFVGVLVGVAHHGRRERRGSASRT